MFVSRANEPVTQVDLEAALMEVGAADADILYVHTGMSFGSPSPLMSRKDLLSLIFGCLLDLGVPTLCFPTYTFSFCNSEIYNPRLTRSRMGALNEFVRQSPDSLRSRDPLMSVAVVGIDQDLALNIESSSIGRNSTFDLLSRKTNVKFLFFGVNLGDCFTFMHYLEWIAQVPYRYERAFLGTVQDDQGETSVEQTLFVRYDGVRSNGGSYAYGRRLEELGLLRKTQLGDGSLSCVSMDEASDVYLETLSRNPYAFIMEPFDPSVARKTFIFGPRVAL